MSCVRGERGQTATEYLGVLVVVAAIVVAIASTGVADTVACGIKGAVAKVAGASAPSCASAPDAGPKRADAPVPATPTPPADAPGFVGGPIPPPFGPAPLEPGRELPADYEPNGCGPAGGPSVPNAPGGYDFEGSCNGHDRCYAQQRGRKACDWAFYVSMLETCAKETSRNRQAACATLASTYYTAVRLGGGIPYWNAGRE